MKDTFTREEVIQIITGLCVFSGANNDQGLKLIYGRTYGEQSEHVVKCADGFDPIHGSGLITMVGKLNKPI